MSLTLKDLITTLLASLAAWFSYSVITGYKLPLISGYRWATLVLLIIGIGMCALSGATPNSTGPLILVASMLGIAALILAILSFIFATKSLFLAFAATILLLWAISTIRHLFS